MWFKVLGSKAKSMGGVSYSKRAVDRNMCRLCGPMWAVGCGYFREIVCQPLRVRGKEFLPHWGTRAWSSFFTHQMELFALAHLI